MLFYDIIIQLLYPHCHIEYIAYKDTKKYTPWYCTTLIKTGINVEIICYVTTTTMNDYSFKFVHLCLEDLILSQKVFLSKYANINQFSLTEKYSIEHYKVLVIRFCWKNVIRPTEDPYHQWVQVNWKSTRYDELDKAWELISTSDPVPSKWHGEMLHNNDNIIKLNWQKRYNFHHSKSTWLEGI